MNLSKFLCVVILLVVPGIAAALPSDRQQKIEVASNSASLNNETGVLVYHGKVVMIQGSTRITGDKVTVYSDKDRNVTKVIAEGKRAFYEEQLGAKQGKVEAWGETIKYYLLSDRIELLKQAELLQDGDIFKGDTIDYNLKLHVVNASGKSPKNGDQGRVQMIIQPRSENKQSSKGG